MASSSGFSTTTNDDHNPPHFHAAYGEHEILVNINTLAILSGGLPARALGLVTEAVAVTPWSHNNAVHRPGARGARPGR